MGDDEQQIDVFDDQGNRGQIPASSAHTAFGERGFKYATQDGSGAWKSTQPVMVTDPEGHAGWLPSTKVDQAVKERGFTVGQPMTSIGDTVDKGKFNPANPRPANPFITESLAKINDATQGTGHMLKVGGKTLLKVAADPSPAGIARSFSEEAQEQQENGGIPKSRDIAMAPLREIAGERQPGESATLGFTGHDPAQQPLPTRVASAMSNFMGGDPASARQHFSQGATFDANGNPGAASEENQRGTADLLSVPLATVGTGRLFGETKIAPIARKAASSAASSIASLPFENLTAPESRSWLAKKVVAPLVRRPVGKTLEDARFGRSPAAGITDEGLMAWSQKGLGEKAQGRISELSSTIDEQLKNHANANVQIDAEPIIDQAIDQAIAAARKSGNPAVETRLGHLRAALKTEYGPTKGTPFEINNLKRQVGDVGSDLGAFKSTDPVEASAASAMGDVYQGLKNAVNQQVPEVAPLNERVSNLISTQTAIKRNMALHEGKSFLDNMSPGKLALKPAQRIADSAPIRTGAARLINMGNKLDVPEIQPMVQPQPIIRPPQNTYPVPPSSAAIPAPPPIERPRLDPTGATAANLSMLRNELIKETDPAKKADIQQALEHYTATAKGEPFRPPSQDVVEKLPAMQPREIEPGIYNRETKTTTPAGKTVMVPTKDIKVKPDVMQFRTDADPVTGEQVGRTMDNVKFDQELAGPVDLWKNPQTGETLLADGHHRLALANRSGTPNIEARFIESPTAEGARTKAAFKNIAGGNASLFDAAKFFREFRGTGVDPVEELARRNIALSSGIAKNALSLSNLDPSLFDKIRTGQLSEAQGSIIGEATSDPAIQESIIKEMDLRTHRGRSVTDSNVAELAKLAKSTGTKTEATMDLFGGHQKTTGLLGEFADAMSQVRRDLASRQSTFGAVAKESKAKVLGSVEGQSIVPGENARISREASQIGELFDKFSTSPGPVNNLLVEAANKMARGSPKDARLVREAVSQKVIEELRKMLPGGDAPPPIRRGTDAAAK